MLLLKQDALSSSFKKIKSIKSLVILGSTNLMRLNDSIMKITHEDRYHFPEKDLFYPLRNGSEKRLCLPQPYGVRLHVFSPQRLYLQMHQATHQQDVKPLFSQNA